MHALRIAALVNLIKQGSELKPVDMELSEYNRNLNYVNDGHHRIRALKYLNQEGFWATLGGFERLINEFQQVCKNPKKFIRNPAK